MKHQLAIRTLRAQKDVVYKDCVDFARRYLELVWERKVPYPNEKELTSAAVCRVLGTRPRRKGGYGDLVLHDGGIGINLGYKAMATILEDDKTPCRVSMPEKGRMLFFPVKEV